MNSQPHVAPSLLPFHTLMVVKLHKILSWTQQQDCSASFCDNSQLVAIFGKDPHTVEIIHCCAKVICKVYKAPEAVSTD